MCRGTQPAGPATCLAVEAELEAGLQKLPPQPEAQGPSQARALGLVLGHALCASCLLVVNKWALKEFPFVWTLTTLQFSFAALATWAAGRLGLVDVDALDA